MSNLIAFISARLDDDEAAARHVESWDAEHEKDMPEAEMRECIELASQRKRNYDQPWWAANMRHYLDRRRLPGDPARVLREVEAMRALLVLHKVNSEPERWGISHSDPAMRGQPTGRTSYWCDECDHDRDYGHIGGPVEGCPTLHHLAAIWSDHPDYRAEEWKP